VIPPPGPRARGPLLGIDGGLRRIGFARSDEECGTAFGLPTLLGPRGAQLLSRRRAHPALERRLEEIHRETPLTGFVLGWPLHEDGGESDLCPALRFLAGWLHERFRAPVALWDEFGSTRRVRADLLEAPHRIRRDRGLRDQLAARSLLQEFLDAGSPFEEHDWKRVHAAGS